jgi:hypothetical protein
MRKAHIFPLLERKRIRTAHPFRQHLTTMSPCPQTDISDMYNSTVHVGWNGGVFNITVSNKTIRICLDLGAGSTNSACVQEGEPTALKSTCLPHNTFGSSSYIMHIL